MNFVFFTAVVDSGIFFFIFFFHIIHFLQPLNIGIFGSEIHWIFVTFDEIIYTKTLSISSLEFFQIVFEVWFCILHSYNIFFAWCESGISFYQLQIVFEKFCRNYLSTFEHCSFGEVRQ